MAASHKCGVWAIAVEWEEIQLLMVIVHRRCPSVGSPPENVRTVGR